MAFQLSPLPFSYDALAPHISKQTLSFHHDKHHQAYVDETNKLIAGSPLADSTLEEIVRESSGSLFNNAAQAWNHAFYWHCLSPGAGGQRASRSLEQAVADSFGGKEAFLEQFAKGAAENFGSGWTWLVKDDGGELSILNTSNAESPLAGELVPLLVVDVWEHAYYLDYQNARMKYLEAFSKVIHWKFASERFESPDVFNVTREMRPRYVA